MSREERRAVGRSLPHDASKGHVTGQSLFLDDLPAQAGELLVGVVGSMVACGRIVSVHLAEASKIPGVIGLYTGRDIPGHNQFGPIVADEYLLAEERVSYIGEPIVVIAAETPDALAVAKRAVRIEIETEAPILSITAARAAESFLGAEHRIERGDVAAGLNTSPHRLRGTLQIGGQEHLYLETQGAIAYPGEEGQIVVHSSTQNPTEIQHTVAHLLGKGQHEIVGVCRRMGGGFGGKETQAAPLAMFAALVTHYTRRPARLIYDRREDMARTGKRHPYVIEWEVGFTDEGVLTALRAALFSDGGATFDLSSSVMDRSLFHMDNAYFLPDVLLTGRVCRTNLPSNTAFRGFGGPQAVAAIENILEEIALYLKEDAYEVRLRNCYGAANSERGLTPYGQAAEGEKAALPALFTQLADSARYRERRAEIIKFNAQSRTHLRGISITLVKFGISFTSKFLNQSNALVNVYTDGTVQVSTGGTEMGQGLNTKIRQLVADTLGVTVDSVRVLSTSTEKNNNAPPTAASAGTDLNGSAAVLAATQIRQRLTTFAAQLFSKERSGASSVDPAHIIFEQGFVFDRTAADKAERRLPFGDLARLAHRERIDLGQRSFYATPGLDRNRPFFYYTTGGAAVEVEIDRLTGEMRILQADILMDIGRSINPAIDRGQVIGGFVQGLGWVTTEDLRYNRETGALLSAMPSRYKVPTIADIPPIFNVAFVEDAENPVNVASSKAVGEPPLLLGIAAWTAAKHALSFAVPDVSTLMLPATGEAILRCLSPQTEATQ
jgi:xanthine dehydrogenase large subunit